MTYDQELWRMPDDQIWALKAAAEPSGMMPNAETTARLLKTMELDGLVRRSDTAPVWFITDVGRAHLSALEDWMTIAPKYRTQERLAEMLAAPP